MYVTDKTRFQTFVWERKRDSRTTSTIQREIRRHGRNTARLYVNEHLRVRQPVEKRFAKFTRAVHTLFE